MFGKCLLITAQHTCLILVDDRAVVDNPLSLLHQSAGRCNGVEQVILLSEVTVLIVNEVGFYILVEIARL